MYLAGDINGDGHVNQTDLGIMNAAMNTCEGDQGYRGRQPGDERAEGIDQADLGVLLTCSPKVDPVVMRV